ncbi:MAG TPA: AAA family ATPase, partial [Patescibacteria group bacterium]|nr:AAA family ATPase [Patescibacteria group bacterium]
MQFTKLEIQGFKSFADKTTLEFSHKVSGDKKGITAVVGPNGSGKSNIADAVRWVLGEQSLKILRGKLSEDVVFAGSEMKSRLNFAEVTATFDNSDNSAPLEYPEIVIRRRIFRSGESEYHINNSKVRLQDIVLFLAKAHVGQKSYSVIGQGMIDQIFALTPEARKNFFDEATGVKEYQIKRDQAILKINHTRENLKEVEIQLAEIEPRLRSLTRQKKRLEERAEVEKTLRELQRIHF